MLAFVFELALSREFFGLLFELVVLRLPGDTGVTTLRPPAGVEELPLPLGFVGVVTLVLPDREFPGPRGFSGLGGPTTLESPVFGDPTPRPPAGFAGSMTFLPSDRDESVA